MSEKEVHAAELVESIGTVEELKLSEANSAHSGHEHRDEGKVDPGHVPHSEEHPVRETEIKESVKEEQKAEKIEVGERKLSSEGSDSSVSSLVERRGEGVNEVRVVENQAVEVRVEAVPEQGKVAEYIEKFKEFAQDKKQYLLGGGVALMLAVGFMKLKRRRG